MRNGNGTMRHIDRGEDTELERRLRAYADARLSPDRWAGIRMRSAVIEHARVRRASAGRRGLGVFGSFRFGRAPRLLAVALAAALAIGVGTSAALAASPGSPLYGVRLWIEAATLPAAPDARLNAQVQQADSRVDEALGAASQGNGGAVAAALAAYRAEIDALLSSAGDDPTKLVRIQAELGRHLAALQALAVSNPDAASAVQSAIDASQTAIDKINARTQGHGRPSSPPGKP
jgi:hypothetical protein